MKYLKPAIICICFFTVFFFHINVSASDTSSSAIDGPAVIAGDGSAYQVELNKEREEGKLLLYTRSYGEFTRPFAADTREFVAVNGLIVHESTSRATGTYIPPDGYVISFTGNGNAFFDSLQIGSTLTVCNVTIPDIPDMYFILDDMLVPIDRINSTRDANQAVLYTPSFGPSTKTNMWGIELTVVDNIITCIADVPADSSAQSGNNSEIPENGSVISVHIGSPYYKQLQEKAKTGGSIKISADSKLFKASKIKYSAYNPRTIEDNPAAWDKNNGKPYDGFRGPDQLIVYDSSYGERTGTNPYGFEVTVDKEGRITGTGGNNSSIPEGGYILSGHGKSLQWLEQYALLGATVILDSVGKEAIVILTPDSYINRAAFSIENARSSLEQAERQYLDIPYDKVRAAIAEAESKLSSIQAQVSGGIYEGLPNKAAEIQKDADKAYFMTFESFRTENRAVWLRPRDTSIAQIQKRLDVLKEHNINILYLETYWGGYAIYPTGSKIMGHNPMYNGLDILGVYLKEAHARGIEVHAWVENFLAGAPVAESKPEWMAVSRKGDTYYLENGVTKYYFLNPALPEVRDFLSGLYKNLVKKYNLDGIQFDYMRYSHSGDYTNDFGYDTYTRELFKGYSGVDPIELKPGSALWDKWCEYRTHLISTYAYRVISEIKSLKPHIKISADVWPEYDKTIADIYQDPKSWTRKGYINNLIPMSYYLFEDPVTEDIMNSLMFARGHSQLMSGIASFNKVDTRVFVRQVNAIRDTHTNGIAIFEFESLFNGDYGSALKLGAFSTPAEVTARDPGQAADKALGEIVRKIDDIYIKYGGMNREQGEKYKKLLKEIPTGFTGSSGSLDTAYAARDSLEKLLVFVDRDEGLHSEVAARITLDLNRIINIVEGYISEARFINEHKVKRFQLEMPYKAFESREAAPYRVKAVFEDNSEMYLDSSQYTVKPVNPSAVEITGGVLRRKSSVGKAAVTLEILSAFNFNTVKDLSRKMEILLPADILLRAEDTDYNSVRLDWGGMTADADIAGYIIYRNDRELARISSESFTDRELQPGETYTYYIQGFDISGKIISESAKITVNTKKPPLVAASQDL